MRRTRVSLTPGWFLGLLCFASASACTINSESTQTHGHTTSTSGSGAGGSGGETTSSSLGTGGNGGSGGMGGVGGTGGTGGCPVGRVTEDRPDDNPGYQVHINYVLPMDGVDEGLDTNGTLATSVGAWSAWMAEQTGGPTLRLDTCDGALDVRFFQIQQTEAELKANGVFIRDAIEDAMQSAGLLHPEKIEVVFYGGDAAETCGGGAWPPALVGQVGAIYLKGTFADPTIPPCASNPVGASPDTPGYIEFATLHEVLHTMGIVPTCAPHQVLSGHTSDSPTDLMYAGNQPWQPSVLDVGHDDYYQHGIVGCPDLATSVFMEPLPANAELPPGW